MFKTDDANYPEIFHIGFMIDSSEQVRDIHARLTADGLEPGNMRDGHGRFTFYFKAPGGFTVEVNSLKETARPALKEMISENIRW